MGPQACEHILKTSAHPKNDWQLLGYTRQASKSKKHKIWAYYPHGETYHFTLGTAQRRSGMRFLDLSHHRRHIQMNSWFVLSNRIWVLFTTDGLTWQSEKRADVANHINNSSAQLKHNGSSQFARAHNNYSLFVSGQNHLWKGEAGNGC